jgi:hypothetical protein
MYEEGRSFKSNYFCQFKQRHVIHNSNSIMDAAQNLQSNQSSNNDIEELNDREVLEEDRTTECTSESAIRIQQLHAVEKVQALKCVHHFILH